MLDGCEPSDMGVASSEMPAFDPMSVNSINQRTIMKGSKIVFQHKNSLVKILPNIILQEILQYVDQFSLVNLLVTCSSLYPAATERLYNRVTAILNAEFPIRYHDDRSHFISENGMRSMDTALILSIDNLVKFISTLRANPTLLQKVRFFIFDKCYLEKDCIVGEMQSEIIDFFGSNSSEMNFLHITFVDFGSGILKLTNFLKNKNIRNKIFKLFITKYKDLYLPVIPQSLTNLFLMLDESELMSCKTFDLSCPPFDVFNSLFTLTCSTNNQLGLEILKGLKLFNGDLKLKLKGLTIFHCHKENFTSDDYSFIYSNERNSFSKLQGFLKSLDKRLDFNAIGEKIDLRYLTHLYLKIDCAEHRNSNCNCFGNFFKDLATYSKENKGLPKLTNFELESFPNIEWLLPHQILENVLTPLGSFIKTLSGLTRLTIDFSTPSFKMFDNNMGMSSMVFNKLNERLIEAFFLCFFAANESNIVSNLRSLQLPDFLTSFIYYKPDFFESLLHSCQCWGCELVLRKLKEQFFPIRDNDISELNGDQEVDEESSYYILIGFILGKLQADREVCIPIKEKTFNYSSYPIYKGQPHTLHTHFHSSSFCKCDLDKDPSGKDNCSIDNLVTTYIIHQLQPIVEYLSTIFFKLDSLMIHGIYYDRNNSSEKLIPIYDNLDYPLWFLNLRCEEIHSGKVPSGPFGYFRRA